MRKKIRFTGNIKVPRSTEEATLQGFVDYYTKQKGIYGFRVPDKFWSFVMNKKHSGFIPLWFKRLCSKYFKSWPDKMLYLNICGKYLLALPMELKSKKGTLTIGQEEFSADLNYTLCKTSDEVVFEIRKFEKFALDLSNLIKEAGLS